jgi:hypothetical protein
MPVSESALGGGVGARAWRTLRPRFSTCSHRLLIWLLAAAILGSAARATALPAPRIQSLLKSSRLAVIGSVASVTSYDDDRVAVVDLSVEQVLKGEVSGGAPTRVLLVEMHEGPSRPPLTAGMRGMAFLRPAARTSYLAKTLPAGSYYELLPEFGSFVAATTPADADQQKALAARIVAAARGEGMNAGVARKLTFDLLAATSPLLVEDGIAGLRDLGQQRELTPEELSVLGRALQRTDLPERIRIDMIQAVAGAGLTEAIPALRRIAAPPPVAEAAWQALDKLGAAPPKKELDDHLADSDPAVRAAAVREVLRRDGVAAVSQVAPVALQDPDMTVRVASVEALGALGKPEALQPLERVFADTSGGELQQATARAILAIGGAPAVDTLGWLAFNGTVESQRYAVVTLMTMDDPHKEEVLKRIAETHSDDTIRDLIANGFSPPSD